MILFFDTETTGLPKDFNAPASDTDNWPRLVQLSYVVSDFYGNQIYTCNEIIKPIDFTIPQASSDIHNITTGIAKNRGSLISDVFELFLIHVKRVDVIVAHNLAFDQKIISSELVRLGIDNPLELKKRICTMKISTDFCEIPGTKGYKWPRLEELHFKLFKSDFAGAHDAYVDAIATAKCFWELERLGLIDISKERSDWRINSFVKMLIVKNKLKTEDVSESNVSMKSIEEILKDAPDGFSTPLDDGLSDSQKFEPKIDDQLVNGVPCLLIGKGELKWAIYDIKNEKLVGGKEARLSEVIGKINLDDKDSELWKDSHLDELNGLFNEVTDEWNDWFIAQGRFLCYKDDVAINVPKLLDLSHFAYESEGLKFSKNTADEFFIDLGVIALYKSNDKNFSKVMEFCQDGDEEGRPECPYWQTLFYIDSKGNIYFDDTRPFMDWSLAYDFDPPADDFDPPGGFFES